MTRKSDSLPSTAPALKKLLVATQQRLSDAQAHAEEIEARAAEIEAHAEEIEARALGAEANARNAEARALALALEVEKMKFTILKLRHERYGQSSERGVVLDQLELHLAEMEENVSESEAAAQIAARRAAEKKIKVEGFERLRPARRAFPQHLPRERVVEPAPEACGCCGGSSLRKIGEDVSETLERIPQQWKVIQHVREKFSCRACEKISQPSAPSHPISRGRAGPVLLAHILFCKYVLHLPLTRQSATYANEGIDLDVSTLADWVGACSTTLMPIAEAIQAHVFAAQRIHADETTVKVQAKHKCKTGRLWAYVRDDRPFAGTAPPAVMFYYSPDREGRHPQSHLATYHGLMQADAYAGFIKLYDAQRKPGPITEQACWAHARRKFFDLARLSKSPIAAEAVARIDALFNIERDIKGSSIARREEVRREQSKPLVDDLRTWFEAQLRKLSAKSELAKAIHYSLVRWDALTRFVDDGRLCISNNAAERELRTVAVGRHNWTFAGSDEGGRRAAVMYTLFNSAKLNNIDPQAWIADVLRRIADHPMKRIDELLPWNWKPPSIALAA